MGEECGMRRKFAGEKRFSTEKDIRLPVVPFVRSIVHLNRISFSRPHGYLFKVFRSCTRFLYSLLFSDISYLLLLFVLIKVLCCAVTRIGSTAPNNLTIV